MGEAISHHIQNLADHQISYGKTVTMERKNACKKFTVKIDCRMMVASGPSTNLAQLESLPPTFQTSRKASVVPELYNYSFFAVGRSVKEDGTRALCTLLQEQFMKNDTHICVAKQRKFVVPDPA